MSKDLVKSCQSKRPDFEVSDIFRDYGDEYEKTHPMSKQQRKVMHDIRVCRTAFLGGHLERCDQCASAPYGDGNCDYFSIEGVIPSESDDDS